MRQNFSENWFDILKEDSLEEKQKRRRELFEIQKKYYNQTGPYGYPNCPIGFQFYGSLEIISMLGRKYIEKAYLHYIENAWNWTEAMESIENSESMERMINFNPTLSLMNSEGNSIIYILQIAGPNIYLSRGVFNIPVKEFIHIYPSGFKGYKINKTVEERDLKRLINYFIDNDGKALEVPREVLPKIINNAPYKNRVLIKYPNKPVIVRIAVEKTEGRSALDVINQMREGGFKL